MVTRVRRAWTRHLQCYGPWRGAIFFIGYVLHIGTGTLTRTSTRYVDEPVWLRRGTTDDWVFQQVFVQRDYDIDYATDAVGSIIDAGANIGLASVWYAQRFPGASIVAVEPERENAELLKRNLSHLPNATVIEAALWTHSGTIDLVDPGLGSWAFQTTEAGEGEAAGRSSTVRSVTVPEIMDEAGWSRVDLFKIDIEGSEREVFQSSSSWLPSVDRIMAELHDRYRDGCTGAFYAALGDDFPVQTVSGENVFASRF